MTSSWPKAKKVLAKGQKPPQELEVRHGRMELTRTHDIDMDSWYRHGLMVQTWTYGIDKDLWY